MEWKTILEEILAERRQQLGEPPSTDDFIALRAGELSDDERERLLEHASVDPEAARELLGVLRFPEPSGDEDPGDDEIGVRQRWQDLRERLVAEGDFSTTPAPVPVPKRSVWWPLAAMFVLGVATTLFFGRMRQEGGSEPSTAPRINLGIIELLPAGEDVDLRGGAEVATLDADSGGLVLTLAVPTLSPSPDREPYRLTMTRSDDTTSTVEGLRPGIGGVFVLDIPREHLSDGLHELRLSDADGQSVAIFHLEVELRQ